MRILGIDEAGRGSVLGSMFLCGFVCSDKDLPQLKKLGVKDSKSFGSTDRARQKRCLLSKKLKENFSYQIEEVSAAKIDTFVKQKGLNQLEREVACKIIDSNQCVKSLLLYVFNGKRQWIKFRTRYLRVISIELECLKELSSCIDNHYTKVVQLLYKSKGKVIWIGMGKSGHIAKKIASTMSSTGTPACTFIE